MAQVRRLWRDAGREQLEARQRTHSGMRRDSSRPACRIHLLLDGLCQIVDDQHEGERRAMARRLAVRLYWMWRKGWDYEQLKKFGSQGRKLRVSCWRTDGFHSIAEAAKFPNHPSSTPAS